MNALRSYLRSFALLAITCSLLPSSFAEAEPNVIGEIEIEATEEIAGDPYGEAPAKVVAFMTELQQMMQRLKTGARITPPRALDEYELTFLNASYLYCATRRGTCPAILDAILESDVIRSHA